MPRTAPLPSWTLEETAEELYEEAPCGYLSTAADGTVVRVNGTLLRWLGLRREEVVGVLRFADLLATGSRLLWLTHHVPALAAEGTVRAALLELVRPDGATLPVLVSARLLRVAADAPPVVRITALDAGERRRYETELRAARTAAEAAERRTRALQEVTRACATSTTPEELAASVVDAVARAYGLSGCTFRVGARAEDLQVVASYGGQAPLELELAEEVLAEPAVVVRRLGDATAAQLGWSAAVVAHVPVRYGGQPLGSLALLLGPGAALSPQDAPSLGTVGDLVGMALTRTRFYRALQRLALHDELTGLPNRVALEEALTQALAHTDRSGEPLAVLLVDLDGFKEVNDSLGHAAGDAVLVACAERLRATVRDADVAARLGGDEFVVVSAGMDEAAAGLLAERIALSVGEPVALPDGAAQVAASIGVAVHRRGDGLDPGTLLARADAAMYAEKRQRRTARLDG